MPQQSQQLTASSMVVTESTLLKLSIILGGSRSSDPAGPDSSVIGTLDRRSDSRVRGASFGSLESIKDNLCLTTRYRIMSSFGFPDMARSIKDRFAEVCILIMRPLALSRFTATGQEWVSTSH